MTHSLFSTSTLVCLILVLGLCSGIVFGRVQEVATADEILERAQRVYAECTLYRDSGTATIITYPMKVTVKKSFQTLYIRPNQFRFEYSERRRLFHSRFIVWQSGRDFATWWNLRNPKVQNPDGIRAALNGPTGISGASSAIVPFLLYSAWFSENLLNTMTNVERLDDTFVDGLAVYQIRGSRGVPFTMWIDKSTFLIRRVEIKMQSPLATETIDYHPSINLSILAKDLTFRAP